MAKPKLCELNDQDLEKAINGYFEELEAEPTKRGAPADLLARLNLDFSTAQTLVRGGGAGGQKRARLLKQAAMRLRAHMETSAAWGGQNGVKSMFLMKQPLWDGIGYADKQEGEKQGGVTVKIQFGDEKCKDKGRFFD